jgi:hypothetical protein
MSSMQDGPGPVPTSDEELQKSTVGERKPHNAHVTLVEYDPRWPELFARDAGRARGLGWSADRVDDALRRG